MLHAKTPFHHRGTITTSGQLHRPLYQPNLPGSRLFGDGQRGIGFSVAEILDLANFKRSCGSSEKDADRKPAAAAVEVAGHLVSSLSAPVYILGAISKTSVRCEQLYAYKYLFK